jgi:hypothetical protein
MLGALEEYYEQMARAHQLRAEAKMNEADAYEAEGDDRERRLDRARIVEAMADKLQYEAESILMQHKAQQMRTRRERTQQSAAQNAATSIERHPRPNEIIQPGDRLMIRAVGVSPDDPIAQEYIVEPSGAVALGPSYGRVQVGGLSLVEAERAIVEHLKQFFRTPQVQVTPPSPSEELIQLDALRAEIRALRAELNRTPGASP